MGNPLGLWVPTYGRGADALHRTGGGMPCPPPPLKPSSPAGGAMQPCQRSNYGSVPLLHKVFH